MEVVCESCGVANPDGVEFCMFCGAFLDWSGRADNAPTTTVRGPGASASTARPPAYAPAGPEATDDTPVTLPSMRRVAPGPAAVPPAATPQHTFVPTGSATGVAVLRGTTCPACGRANDETRHFCSRCGQTLREEPPEPAVAQTTAWRRMLADRDRSARRAYRRSLPPLYRWRRAVLAVLLPALVVGGLVATGRQPVRWVQERWWDLKGSSVPITGITATTSPANASAAGSDPAALVDGTEQAWSEPWNPPVEGDSCGGAPRTGMVVLTFAPVRVREIDINAGLAATNADRPLENRPQAIGVRFDSGPCRNFTLPDVPDLQRLAVDSQVPVTTISIGVDTTYPARADGRPVLSITEVALRSRPS